LTQWGGYIKWAKITGKYEAERAEVAASFNLRKGAMVAATFRLRQEVTVAATFKLRK